MNSTQPPRCTEPACPVRYRGGPDRPCPMHADRDSGDTLAARMQAFADLSAMPGERGDGGLDGDGEAEGSRGQ